MISNLVKEFKNIIWPTKKQVKTDFVVTLVIATILMVLVLLMDNGTQLVFEKVFQMVH